MPKSVKKMSERQREIIGILLMALGFLVLLSLVSYNPTEEPTFPSDMKSSNYLGYFGIFVSHYLIKLTFGWGAFCFPIIFGIVGGGLFTNRPLKFLIEQSLYFIGLGIWLGLIIWTLTLFNNNEIINYTSSGLFSSSLGKLIYDFVGGFGLFIVLIVSIVFLVSGYFKYSIQNGLIVVKDYIKEKVSKLIFKYNQMKEAKNKNIEPEINIPEEPEEVAETKIPEQIIQPEGTKAEPLTIERHENEDSEEAENNINEEGIEIGEVTQIEEGDLDSAEERRVRFLQYKLPPLDLLYNPPEIREDMSEEILNDKAKELEHALDTFGVLGRVVRISPGPIITLFEVEPSEGVRVNKFVNLADDLARIMKAQRVRIIAPIPGSKTVGIELPNINPAIVFIRNILNFITKIL